MTTTPTAIWRVRPSGSNTNGGGYDPGISGAATDYSQQNAAQASGTHGSTSGAGSTTFVDSTANAFTSAMVGNAIWIASGTNFQVGAYFVTGFTSASTITLDRTPSSGGAGSVGVWALGGGWADFWTNTDVSGSFGSNAGNWLVPGNTIYILGSGTPNPASYVYDYTSTLNFTPPNGDNTTNGYIVFANDPLTTGYKAPPDTTGGMPTVKHSNMIFFNANGIEVDGLWFVRFSANTNGAFGAVAASTTLPVMIIGCVIDQFGFDVAGWRNVNAFGCEVFSSQSGSGSGYGVQMAGACELVACNIHDCVAGGVFVGSNCSIINNIIAKNAGDGVNLNPGASTLQVMINNTVDGNSGNGFNFTGTGAINSTTMINNIISNHTGVGKFGVVTGAGSGAAGSRIAMIIDYNSYYNNTANYSNINAGPHDTALAVTPYVASATENYTLA